MKYTSKSLEETQKIAYDFLQNININNNSATVVGLYGDLGAGKTSFTQGLSKVLGVEDNIVSPTFVIEKIYELTNQRFTHLIHIDAYRLENSKELLNLGWEKIISNRDNLIVVEWPEKVADIMPEHIKINLKHSENQNYRDIEVMV